MYKYIYTYRLFNMLCPDFAESRAVTETVVISQDIYFSDICQAIGTFNEWHS